MTTRKTLMNKDGYLVEDSYCHNFCGCCGAKWRKEKMTPNARMIQLLLSEVAMKDTDKNSFTVVQTQNGPITVGVRHAW